VALKRRGSSRFEGAIIAAGHGNRLRSEHQPLPKPLVELEGRSLLERQVESLLEVGAAGVHVVVNSETASLLEKRSARLPADVALRIRDTPNSMESLFTLGETLSAGWFLMVTVDALFAEGHLLSLVEATEKMAETCDGLLGITSWRGDPSALFVHLDPDNLITRLGANRSERVTAGAYFLNTRIFDFVEQARAMRLDALREFLGFLIAQGVRLKAFDMGAAIDIDEQADLAAARAMLSGERGGRRR
jgi:choline kinase